MKNLVLIACCLLVCLTATQAMAVNSVVVESKSAAAGATNVQVGVFLTNDVGIVGLVVPLEVRTQSGTAFYYGNLLNSVFNFTASGRLKNSPLGDIADPGGQWPAGNVTRRQYADPTTNSCSGPTSSTFAVAAARGDTTSPDGFMLATVSTGDPNVGELTELDPGTDGATPSLLFTFNLLPNNGCMVIDTACVTPANHLVGVDASTAEVFFSFTPGFLTVGSGSCASNQPPTAICQNVQVAAGPTCQAAVTAAQVNNGSSDPEDGTNVTLALVPAGPYGAGVNNVKLIVTDQGGLADTCDATITVVDETDPVVTCRPDTTLSVPNGTPGIVVNFTAGTATDNCDGSVTIVATPASGSSFPVGSTPVVVIATDDAGNADTCTFNVIVNELPPVNTPPTAICQNIQVGTDANCQGTATAAQVNNGSNDAQDGTNLTLALVPAGPYSLGANNVKLIVTDQGGLADTCDAVITVVDDDDPVISCPDTVTVACFDDVPPHLSNIAGLIAAGGSATDNCDANLSMNWTGQTSEGDACTGYFKYFYLIFDDASNEVGCEQVFAIRDTIAPVVTCPSNINVTVSNGTTDTIINYAGASASDNCTSPSVSYSKLSGTAFPVGVTVVTVIATDECGNADTCTFSVTVTEEALNAPPVAICQNLNLNADANCQANGSVNNGSFDPDGGAVTVEQTPAGPYGLGVNNVSLIVTDDEGDKDTCFATITVIDVTDPVVTCPANVTVNNDAGQCGAIVNYPAATAVDNCDGSVSLFYSAASGSFFPAGTTTVAVIGTDDAGNADTCYFDVTVNDVEDPVALCAGDINVPNSSGQCGAVVNWTNSIGNTDNCGVNSSVFTPASGSFFPVGSTQVMHVVTDAAGNADTCYFNVNVSDAEGPQITCPSDITVNAPFGQNSAVVNYSDPAATDNCPGLTTRCHPPSGSSFPIGQTLVTCTTFAANNQYAVCTFTITVNEGSLDAPGPHTDIDTVHLFGSTALPPKSESGGPICGCDTASIFVYCLDVDAESCWYNAEHTIPGITVNPNPGWAPRTVDIIGCGQGLAPDTYSGWIVFHDAPGLPTDSVFVIFNVAPEVASLAVAPDTLAFTYTGDIYNDKLCLPAAITSTGCSAFCWSLVGGTGDWVWVDPTSGFTPDEVEICVTPCALEAGVYYQTLTFCPCPDKGEDPPPVSGCDQLVVKLTVVDPPALVVDPLNIHFELKCDQKANPLPVEVSNGGGGVLDWNAWTNANWFSIVPDAGQALDTFFVALNMDSIKCPEVCDTLIDSICVYGNLGCALNSPQWVVVELVICRPDSGICDSLCGWVTDLGCLDKTYCHVNDANVELWSSYPDGVLLASTTTVDGRFCFDVQPGAEYDIRVWKKGYCTVVEGPFECADGEIDIDLKTLDFVPLPNWPYFTDYYSINAQFMAGGAPYPIQPGDVIYATDPNGVICGVYWVESTGVYLIHVLGDDPKTLVDEGAEAGDQITLWLNCECPAVAPDTWANFGSYQFDALWDCETPPLCCVLCEGWNMWSYNRILPDYAREAVLATIDLSYDAVRSGLCDYGSISWFDGRPVNDLTDVSPWFGYDIHMLQEGTICLDGTPVDPTRPIELCAGWNYIPYLPQEVDNLSHALQSLDGNYSHIFTMYCGYGVASWNEGREPQNNDLTCMEPCKGYWINMKTDDTLIYPAEAQGCALAAKVAANSASGRVTATPMVADFYAPSSDLSEGALITVRTSSGHLIGEATVGAGGAFLIHVYGDVPQTPEVEGAVSGEELTFAVDGMAASVAGNGRWYDRDNSAITLTVDEAGAVPNDYALLQNYPNPFNAGTVIPFNLRDASQWNLTVYNVMGQSVRSFAGFDAAGTVRVTWDGLDQDGGRVPSGVYFYRVTTPDWSATKKMTLLK
ncbi:MAG TPA: HYR domain-containing protein [bacterium]|nr:HYR domain-containing protein [bacterium]